MRRNRRRYARLSSVNHKVLSLFTVVALVVTLGACANLALRSSIGKIGQDISRLENEVAMLRNARTRAVTQWSGLATPEKLDAALRSHGLCMELARGERIISLCGRAPARMDSLGLAETELASYEPAQRQR